MKTFHSVELPLADDIPLHGNNDRHKSHHRRRRASYLEELSCSSRDLSVTLSRLGFSSLLCRELSGKNSVSKYQRDSRKPHIGLWGGKSRSTRHNSCKRFFCPPDIRFLRRTYLFLIMKHDSLNTYRLCGAPRDISALNRSVIATIITTTRGLPSANAFLSRSTLVKIDSRSVRIHCLSRNAS